MSTSAKIKMSPDQNAAVKSLLTKEAIKLEKEKEIHGTPPPSGDKDKDGDEKMDAGGATGTPVKGKRAVAPRQATPAAKGKKGAAAKAKDAENEKDGKKDESKSGDTKAHMQVDDPVVSDGENKTDDKTPTTARKSGRKSTQDSAKVSASAAAEKKTSSPKITVAVTPDDGKKSPKKVDGSSSKVTPSDDEKKEDETTPTKGKKRGRPSKKNNDSEQDSSKKQKREKKAKPIKPAPQHTRASPRASTILKTKVSDLIAQQPDALNHQ